MKKFLFDQNDFDKNTPVAATYTEEQAAQIKAQAYAQGKSDGQKEALQSIESQIAKILQLADQKLGQMVAREELRDLEKSADTIKLCMQIVHKILPQFAEKCALDEIERVILQSLATRRDEPRIAVTVPSAHLDALTPRIDALALEKGYAGKVILIADDNMGVSDCRVEWADGGMERLYASLFSKIETELTKTLTGVDSVANEIDT